MPKFLHQFLLLGVTVLGLLSTATCQGTGPGSPLTQWSIISTVPATAFTPPADCSSSTLWLSTTTDIPSPEKSGYNDYADAVLYKADCFKDTDCCPEGFIQGVPEDELKVVDVIYNPGVCPSGYIGQTLGNELPMDMKGLKGAQYCCPSSIPATSHHGSARHVVCATTKVVEYNLKGQGENTYSYPTIHVVVATPIYVVPPSSLPAGTRRFPPPGTAIKAKMASVPAPPQPRPEVLESEETSKEDVPPPRPFDAIADLEETIEEPPPPPPNVTEERDKTHTVPPRELPKRDTVDTRVYNLSGSEPGTDPTSRYIVYTFLGIFGVIIIGWIASWIFLPSAARGRRVRKSRGESTGHFDGPPPPADPGNDNETTANVMLDFLGGANNRQSARPPPSPPPPPPGGRSRHQSLGEAEMEEWGAQRQEDTPPYNRLPGPNDRRSAAVDAFNRESNFERLRQKIGETAPRGRHPNTNAPSQRSSGW
ncbi:hypothetical protein AOL_s00043g710 [Orbilia oligospora ATCC 24927]|uniref:Uncharacterized protein n=1 Tax=Arthrobotrys oligospora (strain ATCC 24927 / CBS 115.81 / DSM 1491) TaxID=756982 RepID=G1X4T6_ARTOA|nr:hypothetical protein AOL_s00043g710 [Orbilia oligospora ATCC 24927]EGX51976.1 hypothetical protein AOL_s00043g710 [Orbilia oligospora ATCC 24927]